MLQFKRQLKHYLEHRKISASELARRSGVPKQTISNWLAGIPPHGLVHMKHIADSLGVSLDELCYGDTWKSPDETEITRARWANWEDACPRSGLFSVTSFDGHPRYIAPGLVALLGGWTERELRSRSILDFVHREDRIRAIRLHSQHLREGSELSSAFEFRLLRKDRLFCWVRRSSIVSHRDQLVFSTYEDVSQRYPLEKDSPDRHSLTHLLEDIEGTWNYSQLFHQPIRLDCEIEPETLDKIEIRCQRTLLGSAILALAHSAANCLAESQDPKLKLRFFLDPSRTGFWSLEIQSETPLFRAPDLKHESFALPLYAIREHGGGLAVDFSKEQIGFRAHLPLNGPRETFRNLDCSREASLAPQTS